MYGNVSVCLYVCVHKRGKKKKDDKLIERDYVHECGV